VADGGVLSVRRHPGKIRGLEEMVRERPVAGSVGIGHMWWATHGRPSEVNAYPDADCSGAAVVVHKRHIENYRSLRERLLAHGPVFRSETDTEVIAQLVERELKAGADLLAAVRAAVAELTGANAVAVLQAAERVRIVAAKRGPARGWSASARARPTWPPRFCHRGVTQGWRCDAHAGLTRAEILASTTRQHVSRSAGRNASGNPHAPALRGEGTFPLQGTPVVRRVRKATGQAQT